MSVQNSCIYTGVSGIALVSALFEGMAEPMLLCDESLSILAANKAAAELLRIPMGDLVERRVQEILPAQQPEPAGVLWRRPARLEWQSELVHQGEALRLEVSGAALGDARAGVAGWVLTLRRRSKPEDPPEFVGNAPATRELLEFVSRIARSRASSILLVGESGTGKELIARRLHALSLRAAGPFVPINCAALPDSLLEAELFGYEKGAFTSAARAKEGLLETAHGGTVFLDEIGELPLPLQAKLLRVFEDHSFRRIGGTRAIAADLRIIGATNADLEKAVEGRRFRSDLYYRLNGVQITLPPLRERAEDIQGLANHLLSHFNRMHRRNIQGIHPAAQQLMNLYGWPGNVRELRNVVERAVLLETSSLIMPASMVLPIGGARVGTSPAATEKRDPSAHFSLRGGERQLIAAALAEAGGSQSGAARLLGIGRYALRYKMKKLGLR